MLVDIYDSDDVAEVPFAIIDRIDVSDLFVVFTRNENIASILECGALYSRVEREKRGISAVDGFGRSWNGANAIEFISVSVRFRLEARMCTLPKEIYNQYQQFSAIFFRANIADIAQFRTFECVAYSEIAIYQPFICSAISALRSLRLPHQGKTFEKHIWHSLSVCKARYEKKHDPNAICNACRFTMRERYSKKNGRLPQLAERELVQSLIDTGYLEDEVPRPRTARKR